MTSAPAPRSTRAPINTPSTAPRQLAFLGLQPNGIGTRGAISVGKSDYKGLIMGVKRRMTNGFDFTATYTLAESKSNIGTAADELNQNNIQDVALLYNDARTYGPDRPHRRAALRDARGGVDQEGADHLPDLHVPLAAADLDDRRARPEQQQRDQRPRRQGLPVHGLRGHDIHGRAAGDVQGDRRLQDLELQPRRLEDADEPPHVVQPSALIGTSRVELIGEVFNLFNAINPGGFNTSQFGATGTPNASFMQPTSFAGDFQAGEQRVGQVGFRFSF